jgi:hypothetical protein
MTSPPADPKFVKAVAKQLDRRRVRRRLTLWAFLLAAAAAAAGYLRCGHGFGLGGGGGGETIGSNDQPATGPRRCVLRISATGITVDGNDMPREQAVATCKDAGSAELIQVGDAPEGKLTELRHALEAAKVPFVVRESAGGAGRASGSAR